MSLFKRGGVWWNYMNIDGVRYQRSTETGNRRQAEAIAAKQKEELVNRRFQIAVVEPDLRFGVLAAKFLAGGAATIYHTDRLKPLLQFFSDVPVVHITKALCDEYRKRRLHGPAGDSTVNRDLSVLRRIVNWGIDEGLVLPVQKPRVRMVRERRKKRLVVSIDEENAILQSAAAHIQLATIAALDTGMRRGELFNQLWEDVDFPRRLLYVTKSKTPEGESREIPLTTRLFDLLSAQRQPLGLVFTYKGQPLHRIKTAWKATLRRAGLRHIRFHDLRHSFNMRLLEAGVLQEIRMSLMGHSSGKSIHSVYVHIELPLKREAISKLEAWIEKQNTNQEKGGSQVGNTETTGSACETG